MEIQERENLVNELVERSVAQILPSKEEFREKLLSGEKLTIYIGADATGPALHIGHATNYMILERFRKLGHKVILLIGDFTARIGDPTDKSAARVALSREQVVEHTKHWIDQLKPIVSFDDPVNPVTVAYNHDWLSGMTFEEVIGLASNFTVQHMLERDMFEKRMAEGKPIHLHEFFYPLMQGYDSVVLGVDAEICGTDQTFNALAGRTLVQRYLKKDKFVFITTLLENPVTKEKMMSKSAGTGVFLDMLPDEMFGKVMAQPDENIPQLFTDCTQLSLGEIDSLVVKLSTQELLPRDAKLQLAFEITKIYHGEEKAQLAQENWKKTFSEGGIPEHIQKIVVTGEESLVDVLLPHGIISSKSDFRRLVEGGAVTRMLPTEEKVTDVAAKAAPGTYKIGKMRFVEVVQN